MKQSNPLKWIRSQIADKPTSARRASQAGKLKDLRMRQPARVTHSEGEQLYEPIKRAIEKMAMGYSNLCFIRGNAGIGKSYQIGQHLHQFRMDHHEVSGEISEAYLYRLLYENQTKTIWFKDVVRLLKGLRSIDLLKSASETERTRIIGSYNYSEHHTNLPRQFEFKGRLIFDFNSLTGLKFKEDFEALTTRGDFIDLVFSREQIATLMRSVCQSEDQREITEFLINHFSMTDHGNLNLRTQRRAFQTASYARAKKRSWREELLKEIRTQESPVRRTIKPFFGAEPMRVSELKKTLVRSGLVSTIRTADRRLNDWIELGEVFRVSEDERNFLVSLEPLHSIGKFKQSEQTP